MTPEFWTNNTDMLMQSHTGLTNFLFCDGHVKSMKPVGTLGTDMGGSGQAGVNMWNVNNAPPPDGNLRSWLQNTQTVMQ